MDNNGKRSVGRPKARPQTGPLVLEGSRARGRIESEVAEATADELTKYARWVELSSKMPTADAMFTIVDFALREVFRRDRLWQERRKKGDEREDVTEPPTAPTQIPTPPRLPPPSPSTTVRPAADRAI